MKLIDRTSQLSLFLRWMSNCFMLLAMGSAPFFATAQNASDDVRASAWPADVESDEAAGAPEKTRRKILQAQQALAAAEKSLGPEHQNTIVKVMQLARLFRADGQHANALAMYQRALSSQEARFGPAHEQTASALNGMSLIYQDLGKFSLAVEFGKRALEIRKKSLPPDHPDTAASLNNLAGIYRAMGNYRAAQPLYERAIAIKEKSLGPDHPGTATSLNNLALLFKNLGHYQKALPLYERALAISEAASGSHDAITAVRLQNLAELYRLLGRFDKALPLYQRSLAIRESIAGPDHPRIAITLNNLARMHEESGDYALAMPLLQRALAIREKILGPDHPVTAVSLAGIADLHYALRQHDSALPLFRRALAIREAALGPAHPSTAQSLGDLAKALGATGQYNDSLVLYSKALSVAENAGNPEVLWRIQDGLSRLLASQERRDAAIILGKAAVNTLQGMRSRLAELDRQSQRSFQGRKEHVYKDLAERLIAAGRIAEAQQVMAMLKEEEYFDFVRRTDADDPRTTQATLSTQELAWYETFSQIRKHIDGVAAVTTQPDKQQSASTNEQYQILQNHLDSTTGARVESPTENIAAASLEQLKNTLARLGHGAVLLQYLVSDDTVHIVLTTPQKQVARVSPTSAKDLSRQIHMFRELLKYPARDPQALARLLYRGLIEPVNADLALAGAQTLMLSLYGQMRYLPMAALHDGNHYLAERYALAIHTDAVKANLAQRPARTWRVSGLGLTRAMDGFSALPAVKQEIKGILASSASGGKAHFDQEFTSERLQNSLRSARKVLHISSHFVFNWGTDTDSYLLLGDGSRLSLRDIREARYDFSALDLLTLSACNTAIGGGKDAEGREVARDRETGGRRACPWR